ncbi:ABC transporter ATP-binding protein [Niallia sp. 03133]|uniref:ABC transporter ATP-binding protein n=1 Tax=Niallia sp. 03133 TaxID=3458060 RepID=UPI0040442971
MAGLTFHHVQKNYHDKKVVKDFHLDVADKEFLVLVGASGCGKSTILRMIAGLENISEGDIYIGDQHVNGVAPKDRDIAMVFQNYALYPHMNVYKNIAFGLKVRKFSKDEVNKRVLEAAKILDIEHLLERKPKELSGGQRQRVALGRAIVRNPKAFLMDEPLSNLDAKLRVKMRAEISRLHKNLEATIVYVTHDQTEAMTMGDRIVVMHEGVVQQVATPKEIYDHPANKYIAGFIGSPGMNFIEGKIIEEKDTIFFQADALSIPLLEEQSRLLHAKGYVGRAIIFGIRPVNIIAVNEEMRTAAQPIVKGTVDLAEDMGAESLLYVKAGGNIITARVEGRTEQKIGNAISLAFNRKKAHFFDIKTEEAIR